MALFYEGVKLDFTSLLAFSLSNHAMSYIYVYIYIYIYVCVCVCVCVVWFGFMAHQAW